MTNENNNHKNHTTEQQTGNELGRTYNSQHPGVEQTNADNDISAVDQQEGTMNHGETGVGGFTENNEHPPK